MKKYLIFGLLVGLVLSVGVVLAGKPTASPTGFQATGVNPPGKDASVATVTIPSTAVEVAPGVFYLGTAMDNGKAVEGYAFIDYKKGFGKPGTICGNGICEPSENAKNCPADCAGGGGGTDTSSCYGFLAKGAKWKTIEPWIVNATNTRNLDGSFVLSNLSADIQKWETVAAEGGKDILGAGESTSTTLVADTSSPDSQNEVYFANIDSPGAIAITVVWGIFIGPPSGRELVEWDQVYDDVTFDWSASGEAGKMDFENIATHELGHSVGLDDLYESLCSEQTMYGYANYGETKKRDLEAGDVTGIKALYK